MSAFALLLFGCGSMWPAGPEVALAQERSLEIISFHADIRVSEDGFLDVTELIEVRFNGSWNGIFREIPVEYRNEAGFNYTLRLDIEDIRAGTGEELRYESERSGRNRVFRIYVPGASNATRVVMLRYLVRDGLRFFEEHDELYWNVTGDESTVPIRSASARIELPPGVTGVRSTAFAGPRGSVGGNVRIDELEGSVNFATSESLRFREGLTIVVGWDPGIVARPTVLDRIAHFLVSNSLLLIPLFSAGGMFFVWRRHGRDPELGPLMPEYEPPEGLTPGEAGTLFDTSADMRDVTATIVDLAVRGHLTITELEKDAFFGLMGGKAYLFRIAAPRESWDGLKSHERELLKALFDGRDDVETSELENSFYKDLPRIRSKLGSRLTRDGHYLHDPKKMRVAFLILAALVGGLVVFLGGAFLERVLGQEPGAAIAAGVLTALVVVGFGWVMPARTEHGTEVFRRLRGFEDFLRRVESERFERVIRTPEMFERYLPYAMAFGVERNWAGAFEDIYKTPPEWYHGRSYGFRAHSFTNSLSRMSSVTGAAMASAPRSSSGSSGFGGGGMGGGGFSGGGFGGGGVGGF